MATVKVKFRASSVADREGRLFYQIIHNRVTRQIGSGHKLFPSEWDVLQRNILPPNCEGPRHAYLVALKSRIADDKARLERIISRLEHTGESYTAGDVAARYLTPPDAGGFLSFVVAIPARCAASAPERAVCLFRHSARGGISGVDFRAFAPRRIRRYPNDRTRQQRRRHQREGIVEEPVGRSRKQKRGGQLEKSEQRRSRAAVVRT